jgi:hypothetical protein
VHASEAKECLLAAISRREDLSGLSKDCTELIVGQDQERRPELRVFLDLIVKNESKIRSSAISKAKMYLPDQASFEGFNVYLIPMPYNANADHRESSSILFLPWI